MIHVFILPQAAHNTQTVEKDRIKEKNLKITTGTVDKNKT